MYDFYLGSTDEIRRDEARYLTAIKRMMPRWINSLPDSEFLALAHLLDEQGAAAAERDRSLVAVETGAGASTIALVFYALKYDGLALSWDLNSAKGSAIRQVCVESMGAQFVKHVDSHWKLVAADSLSPHLGLAMLGELVDEVDLSFHDSEHTWRVLGAELRTVTPHLAADAVVALDDANLDWEHTNLGYVNTFRRKLGLPDVAPIEGNSGRPFHERCDALLRERFGVVDKLDDLYKQLYRSDPYFAYYDAEFDVKAELGTEREEALEHRFDSWRVSARRS